MNRIFLQLASLALLSGLLFSFSACQQEQIVDELFEYNSEETDLRAFTPIIADAVTVDYDDCCATNNRTVTVTLNPNTCTAYGNDLYYHFYDYNSSSNLTALQASSLCEPDFCLPVSNYALLIATKDDCNFSYDGTTFTHDCLPSSPVYEAFLPSCPLEYICPAPDVSEITWTHNSISKSFTVCAYAYEEVAEHKIRYRTSAFGGAFPGSWVELNPTFQACNTISDFKFSKCFYDVQLSVRCPWGDWSNWSEIESIECSPTIE